MKPIGWLLMLASCGFVLSLVTFCFWRVFSTPQSQTHRHAPLDIDTHDTDDDS